MTKSTDQLRRDATALKKAYHGDDRAAKVRVNNYLPHSQGQVFRHADFLHVIAREQGFASWPHLKATAESLGMGHAQRQQRLGQAISQGQNAVVAQMLAEPPDLAAGNIALCCGLYLADDVARLLADDPEAATRRAPSLRPIIHLARSKIIHAFPERSGDMIAIAELLLSHGADVNDTAPEFADGHALSALYFAIGHAGNMALGKWLLEHGADPNDGESLYHATELGHHDGLRMLLDHGAEPRGTNALLRAMDFHDVEAVRMLLEAGARADDFNGDHVGGEAPWVVPALHQAARRMSPPEMVALLLENGADPTRIHEGVTPYAYARIFGNTGLSTQLKAAGYGGDLSSTEALLALVADGEVPLGQYIDPEKIPPAARNIIRMIARFPDKLDHMKRLVALGVEYDRPDTEGLTPVQIAGWEGLPQAMGYLLSLKPDLGHINSYGGTLFSTILHGSENNPDRDGRDYIGCLRLALEEGVALPRVAPDRAGDPEISAFLRDWAVAHPGQVVEGGPV